MDAAMTGVRANHRVAMFTLVLALCGCSTVTGGSSQALGPTPVPEPPAIFDLSGRGVAVEGHGTTTSDEITPQYGGGMSQGIDVVTLTHDGRSPRRWRVEPEAAVLTQ